MSCTTGPGSPRSSSGGTVDTPVNTKEGETKRHGPENIWLDLLPQDISRRLAVFVSGKQPTNNALHLAEMSDTQAEAVAWALSYSLRDWPQVFGRDQPQQVDVIDPTLQESTRKRWVAVLWPYIQEADDDFPELLNAPKLRKFRVRSKHDDDSNSEVTFIPNKPTAKPLRELEVILETGAGYIPVNLLYSSLSNWCMSLRHLHLHGHVIDPYLCHTEEDEDSSRSVWKRMLADCCPRLESLRLDCSRIRCEVLWDVLPSFPRLKHVELDGLRFSLPGHLVEWMQHLDSVYLRHNATNRVVHENLTFKHLSAQMLKLAGLIGAPLRAFSSYEVAAQGILKLPRGALRNLDILCGGAVEVTLCESLDSFSDLRCLCLKWLHRKNTEAAHTARSGVVLRIVRGLPFLSELRLVNVRLSVDELLEILKTVGSRLKVFAFSVDALKETGLDTYETLLQTLAEHNSSLEYCTFGKLKLPSQSEMTEGLCEQGQLIQWWIRRLRRRAWYLDGSVFQALYDAIDKRVRNFTRPASPQGQVTTTSS